MNCTTYDYVCIYVQRAVIASSSEINKCSVGINTEKETDFTSPIKPTNHDITTQKIYDNVELDLLQGYEKFLTESSERSEVLSQGYKYIHIMNE
jgi:hypothetical protein